MVQRDSHSTYFLRLAPFGSMLCFYVTVVFTQRAHSCDPHTARQRVAPGPRPARPLQHAPPATRACRLASRRRRRDRAGAGWAPGGPRLRLSRTVLSGTFSWGGTLAGSVCRVRQLPKAAAACALRPEPCASPGLHGPRRHPPRPACCRVRLWRGPSGVAVTRRCACGVRSLPERLLSERRPSHARVRVSGRPFRGGGVSHLWVAFRDSARVASRRGSLTNEPGVAAFPLSRCHTSCLGSLQTPGRRDVLPPCLLHTGFTLHVPVLWCCVVRVRGRSVLQQPENAPEPLFVGSFCFGRVCRLRP